MAGLPALIARLLPEPPKTPNQAPSGASQHFPLNNPDDKFVYVSGNPVKIHDMQQLLTPYTFSTCSPSQLQLTHPGNLDALPTLSLKALITHQIKEAFARLQRPVVMDMSELVLDGYPQNFPGILTKTILRQMGSESFAQKHQNETGDVHIVCAFTKDGSSLFITEATTRGQVIFPLKTGKGIPEKDYFGWDAFWLPRGSQQTLAELYQHREIITHRQWVVLDFRSYYFGAEFAGLYEIHVTVQTPERQPHDTDETYQQTLDTFFDTFQQACEKIHQTALNLYIVHGHTKIPAFQTKRFYVCDNPQKAQEQAYAIGRELTSQNLTPIRYRTEAMLRNRDAPQTTKEALQAPAYRYFETHVRVMNPDKTPLNEHQLEQLRLIAKKHGSQLAQKGQHYFLDNRYHAEGRDTVEPKIQALEAALQSAHFQIKTGPYEYLIWDSHDQDDPRWPSHT